MPSSQERWDPLVICEMGLRRHQQTCCGLTKNGTYCKLYPTVNDVDEGRNKLKSLARRQFDLSDLPILRDIASHFLCRRWHRTRQADQLGQQWYDAAVRNIPYIPVAAPVRPETTRITRRHVTRDMLRENNVPWRISSTRPATYSIERGSHSLRLKSLNDLPVSEHMNCLICLQEAQADPVVLKCGRCVFFVHLSCMETWLGFSPPENNPPCPICKHNGAFDAFFCSLRTDGPSGETRIDESVSSEQQIHRSTRSVDRSVDRSSPGRSATDGLAVKSQPIVSTQRRSARLAQQTDPSGSSDLSELRRSARRGQPPERFQ
ncbi:hypothetical protein N7455_001671 [Penicillium solitum]|uniref:uncharacterized protein n=1 Tax=Penicillium solitum TaxID=60172 RepID=UPI002A20AB36|nr:hypothetical protein LCP963914a_9639 [Penicillium roqueforti]KAJ5695428.1 hypothetical protein N7536_005840 [Penicillium majusculum]KAJ5878206.1 hypothetical protein N7455_001671 [Penicillium solitum]KAI2734290.1 hypothetical protein DTO012A1_10112 [Penicillium roqueforti]KAI3114165.1 hypothetical protein CBS147330_9805 [Penicillium roqueforti]